MNPPTRSTAGPRQFDSTAIAKLRARGVPKHIAEAFVKIGLPKSGRVESIRDAVCKMKYQRFFVEKNAGDYADPMRVGAYVPEVIESRAAKFHCEFQMSDIESAVFSKIFPEFEIVAKGRSYNQHAFYANKRYAECELLVQMVFKDAAKCDLDPRSIVDLGGNDSWHVKRGRDYVHCDNPVLSHRDKMRYVVREVFSGSNRTTVCDKKFSECDYTADYAIAVHSTYDISPKSLAVAMKKRGIKKMFGVINYIPGVESKAEGTYELDGMRMKLVRPTREPAYLQCGFVHDASLEYVHKLSVMRRYMSCQQRFDFVEQDGSTSHYTYRICSVRGNSVVYCIDQSDPGVLVNAAAWSPPSNKYYLISLEALGVDKMEVDCEFFDRLVLQAAGARNLGNYDIVSLFRYAKSLRQRVSMNGVVLSSGFSYEPEQLVHCVIAAYATAVAYRSESVTFFRKATAQIINLRGKGFVKNVYELTTQLLKIMLTALPYAISRLARLDVVDRRIRELIASGKSVTVQLYKSRSTSGLCFDDKLFSSRVSIQRAKDLGRRGLPITPYSRYYGAALLPTRAMCEGVEATFYSRGLVSYDGPETVGSTEKLNILKLPDVKAGADGWVEEARKIYYKKALTHWNMTPDANQLPVVLNNGDRLFRYGLKSVTGPYESMARTAGFVSSNKPCVIFRGVGRYAVKLTPPKAYERLSCITFVLFFEKWVGPGDENERLTSSYVVEATGDYHDQEDVLVARLGSAAAVEGSGDVWHEVSDLSTLAGDVSVRQFADPDEGVAFVHQALEQGQAFVSGALPRTNPVTPPPDPMEHGPDHVFDRIGLPTVGRVLGVVEEGSEVGTVRGSNEELTVSSEDDNRGKNSILEYVLLCEEAEKVALASAKMVMDIAISVARGDAPARHFKSVAQQHPGNVKMVRVTEEGEFREYFSDDKLDHMAVSDGKVVYDVISRPPPVGQYVTSDIMMVYTGAGIKEAVKEALDKVYDCPTTCVDGIAGSGKTYYIIKHVQPGDVVLCETRAALEDTAKELNMVPGWSGHAYTMDQFLLHRQVSSAETLWLDEAFRLHEGKQRAIVRLLRPKQVRCFGDVKQIPVLPYLPGIEFQYANYPYSKVVVKKDTWRFGADVCYVLSSKDYYGYHAVTHSPILRSLRGPVAFTQGCLHQRQFGAALLVYSQTCRDDLRSQGVRGVMTIGESQGKTFDHVMLFRDSQLNKALYTDPFQTLVAVTRHRKSFTYVTVCAEQVDSSGVAELIRKARKTRDVVLASHVVSGVRPVADFKVLETRAEGTAGSDSPGSDSPPPEVTSANSEWSLFEEEEEE